MAFDALSFSPIVAPLVAGQSITLPYPAGRLRTDYAASGHYALVFGGRYTISPTFGDDDISIPWANETVPVGTTINIQVELIAGPAALEEAARRDLGNVSSAVLLEALDLDQVDNTSDLDKPISTATQAALDLKADAAEVTAALDLKADAAAVSTALGLKADQTYVDALLAAQDAMVYKGVVNCSANPNYPAADKGHTYRVSVAGKIGGASGTSVEAGDILLCITDGSAAGTQAAVGANWGVIQTNIDGAVVGPASAVDGRFAAFDGVTGKLIKALTAAEATAALDAVVGDSGAGGTKGLTPAPAAGDAAAQKFLKADGAWANLPVVGPPQGRLTLTTGVPVTGDVTGATTVRYTPYVGAQIPIYNGASFVMTTFTELAQATTDTTKSPAAVAADKVYNLYVWNDAGTLRLSRGPALASDTTDPSASNTRTDGVWLNTSAITNGPAALRGTWVGTVRSDGSSQINNSAAKRYVWNLYNRVDEFLRAQDTTDTWTYGTGSFRQANGSTANQLAMVRGLDEDAVEVRAEAHTAYTADSGHGMTFGIGVNSTTVNSATAFGQSGSNGGGIATSGRSFAAYVGRPGYGAVYLAWLEKFIGGSGGSATVYGDNGASNVQAAIWGRGRF